MDGPITLGYLARKSKGGGNTEIEPKDKIMMEIRRESEEKVEQEVNKLLKEIEGKKKEAQEKGFSFSSLSKEELTRKILGKTSQTPFVSWQSWISGTKMGNPAFYNVGVYNPDNVSYYPVFVSIFFGIANFLDDISKGLCGIDNRWPYMSSKEFKLSNHSSASTNFSYTTPSNVPPYVYTGNSVLWMGSWHDKGRYFDRGLFDVELWQ